MSGRNEALEHFLKTGELMDSKTFRERRSSSSTRGGALGSSRGRGGGGRASSLYFTDNDNDLAGLSTGRSRWIKAARRAIKSREGGERPAQQSSGQIGGRPPPRLQRYGKPREEDEAEDEESEQHEAAEEEEEEETAARGAYAEEEHPSGPHMSATAAQRRPLMRAPRVSLKTSVARSSITSLSSEPDTVSPPGTPSSDMRKKKTLFEAVAEEMPSDADTQLPQEAIPEVPEMDAGDRQGTQEAAAGREPEHGKEEREAKEEKEEKEESDEGSADAREETTETGATSEGSEASGEDLPAEQEMRGKRRSTQKALKEKRQHAETTRAPISRHAPGPTASTTARGVKADDAHVGSGGPETSETETEPAGAAVNESATRTVSPAPRVAQDSLEGSERADSEEEQEGKEGQGREKEEREQQQENQDAEAMSKRESATTPGAADKEQRSAAAAAAAAAAAEAASPSPSPQAQPAARNVPLTLSVVGPPGAQMQSFDDFFGDMSLSEASTPHPSRPTTRDGVKASGEKAPEPHGAADSEERRPPAQDVDREEEEGKEARMHKVEDQQKEKDEGAESERQRGRTEGKAPPATRQEQQQQQQHQQQHQQPRERETTPSMIPKRRQRRPTTTTTTTESRGATASSLASPLKSTESGSRLPVARRYTSAAAGAVEEGEEMAAVREEGFVTEGQEATQEKEAGTRHDEEALRATMADRDEMLRHWREADAARASRERGAVEAYAVDHKVKALQHQVKVLTAMVEAGAKQQRDEEETRRIVEEQEGMLANFQRENDRLYKLIKQGDGTTKHMLAHMHAENERLTAENFTLRSRNEVLEQQLAGAGAISNARIAELEGQLAAAQAEKKEREETFEQRCALLEQAVQQLEDKCSQQQALHRDYERATVVPLRETVDALRTEKAELKRRVQELREQVKRTSDEAATAKQDAQTQHPPRTATATGEDAAEDKPAGAAEQRQPAASGGGGGVFDALMSDTARDAHTVLRMKLAEKAEEAQALQGQLEAQKAQMQDKVSAFQKQMADMRSEFEAHTAQLEARLREASSSSSATRPHTRVKELEKEVEALHRRYRHVDEASAGREEDRQAMAALRSERDALEETVSRLQRDVADMRELRGKYESVRAAAKDLEQRLEAALALAEDHRKAKQFAEEKARVASRQLQRDFSAKVAALERRVEEKEQREAAVAELQQMVQTLSRKLETAPSHEQVALYERAIRDLELQVRDKEAELSVARKYHTPAMQHYNLLLQRIAELEAKQREREQQVKDLMAQRDRSRTLEVEDVNNKWRQAFLEKASQVTALRERVEEMTNVLKLLKARGVRIPNPVSLATP